MFRSLHGNHLRTTSVWALWFLIQKRNYLHTIELATSHTDEGVSLYLHLLNPLGIMLAVESEDIRDREYVDKPTLEQLNRPFLTLHINHEIRSEP